MCSTHIFFMNIFSFPNLFPGSVNALPVFIIRCRSVTSRKLSHTDFSVLVHTLSVYIRIVHNHDMRLHHNAKVCKPNLRVRCDSRGVWGNVLVRSDFYSVYIPLYQTSRPSFFLPTPSSIQKYPSTLKPTFVPYFLLSFFWTNWPNSIILIIYFYLFYHYPFINLFFTVTFVYYTLLGVDYY